MTIGNYPVHLVKRGGLGEVYFCSTSQAPDAHWIVLKTFQKQFFYSPEVRKAFVREAINWMKLSHVPYVLPVLHFDYVEERPFLFLVYVPGDARNRTTLEDHLKEGPLDLTDTYRFAFQLALALQTAAKIIPGIIHGDLKPDNLFILNGNLLVADFGLSRTVDSNVDYFGTPPYRAPECWQAGSRAGVGADIYAFGMILYQMLTGRMPFEADTNEKWQQAHAQASPFVPPAFMTQQREKPNLLSVFQKPKPAETPSLQQLLFDLALQCLAKKPEARPPDFRTVLQRLLDIGKADEAFIIDQFTILHQAAHYMHASENVLIVEAYSKILNTLIKLDRIDLAMEELRKIPADAFDAELWHLSGTIHSLSGDDTTALQHLEKAFTEYEDADKKTMCRVEIGLSLKRLGRYDEAVQLFADLLQKAPDKILYNVVINYATVYMEWGKWPEAAQLLESYARRNPNAGFHLWVNLGRAYKKMNELPKALQCFENTLQINPNLAMVHVDAAELLIEMSQNYSQAIHHLEAAAKLGFEDPKLLFLLAETYSNLRDFEAADYYFNIIEDHLGEPGFDEEWWYFAKTFYHRGKGALEQAEACITKALTYKPDNPAYLVQWAALLDQTGQKDQLRQCLEKLTTLRPDDEQLREWLASVQDTQQEEEAELPEITQVDENNFALILRHRLKKYASDPTFEVSDLLEVEPAGFSFPNDFYNENELTQLLENKDFDCTKSKFHLLMAVFICWVKGRLDLAYQLAKMGAVQYPDLPDFMLAAGIASGFMLLEESATWLEKAAEQGLDIDQPETLLHYYPHEN